MNSSHLKMMSVRHLQNVRRLIILQGGACNSNVNNMQMHHLVAKLVSQIQ